MSDPRPGSVVVIGASAGGVEALSRIAADLPSDLAAPVFVVLHVGARSTSALPEILARAGPLPAKHPRTGDPIEPGCIYVAPPDRHLLIEDGRVSVVRGPRENLMRPAIDPLFRSAAVTHGPNVIAVILSGMRDDGAAGAGAVSRRGGVVIVQDPDEAVFPEMPMNAIAQDHPDYVLPLDRIASTVVELIRAPALSEEEKMRDDSDDEMSLEASYSALEIDAVERAKAPGDLTPFSCPECGGTLWELRDGKLPRYRCRVGHAYAAESMLEDQSSSVDRALWIAFRALLERAALSERISARLRHGNGSNATADRFDRLADEAHAQAAVIREVLLNRDASAA